MEASIPPLAPAVVLSVILGALHTCLYVLFRGHLRLHVLLVLPAAIAGAWAGQAIGERLGDPLKLGDHCLLWASALSWVGIIVVSVAANIGGRTPRTAGEPAEAEDA